MTELQSKVKELVDAGKTVSEIAKELNRNKSSISSAVKALGLNPKKAYENTVDHEYFDTIDTSSKAYFLGFFIADGCVSGDKRNEGKRCNARFSFNLQEEDGYILEQLKDEIKASTPVSYHVTKSVSVNRKPQYRLRWTSVHMQDSLRELYGLTERKTDLVDYEFPLEKIPEEFLGSFILGFIDGDGSFEQHDRVFTPSIVGPNKKWIIQVGDIVNKYTGLTYTIYEREGKTCTYYTLRWSANNVYKFEKVQKLYYFLYKNASNFLTRKRDKIEAYLKYRANQLGVKPF